MRILLYLLAMISTVCCADELVTAPTEIKLKNGYVLRRVEVVRFESEQVVLKHNGGVDPIRLEYIADPDRQRLISYRTAFEISKERAEKAKAAPKTISGQVFITTAGAGSYKFSGAIITVYPANLKPALILRQQEFLDLNFGRQSAAYQAELAQAAWEKALGYFLADVIGSTTTDADGNYKITLKGDQRVLLVCTAQRLVGRYHEVNTWVVEAEAGSDSVNLHNHNLWVQPN